MKLALLGFDPTAWDLARAAVSCQQHEIVQICEAEASRDQLKELAPGAIWIEHWESLLHDDRVDAVIVATGEDEELRAEQLRKLAIAVVPVLVVHPVCESIVCYELDMIRRDTESVMLPYYPGCSHPVLDHLVRLSQEEPGIGTLEQVVIERAIGDRSRKNVLRKFCQDVAMLRTIVTDLNVVSAMGPTHQEDVFANLSVHLSSPSSVLARWSMVPAEEHEGGKLTMFGSAGNAVLKMVGPENQWTLEINVSGGQSQERFSDWDGPTAALDSLSKAITEKKEDSAWTQACRDAEFADTIPHSLRRGRAIELQDAVHSEEQTFKGIMSIGGCGLLLFSFFLLIVAMTFEGLNIPWVSSSDQQNQTVQENQASSPAAQRNIFPQQSWQRILPALCLFVPLAIFLLLQLLKLVFYQPLSGSRPPKDNEPNST